RRAGRSDEAVAALESLARSDAGRPWGIEIARELRRIADSRRTGQRDEVVVVAIHPDDPAESQPDSAAKRAA
ncbi:MAG: hypothetical protein ACKOTB_18700, partial [Planctomycetia bacterium]